MSKILGLDLGTNSIGWAVVETEKEQSINLIDKGVHIFQEGVKIEKGIESSKAAERTRYRSARRSKYRRKLRKIQTIAVLSDYGYIPKVSKEELNLWRYKKIYPDNQEFRKWQLTDDGKNENPYFFRDLAVKQKLDLYKKEERYKLGRAFYHITQRRGFLSNRLESTKESNGAVKQEIDKLSEEKGGRTLGQYFYDCYQNKQKIRKHYTHRELHYLEEFNRICDFQNLKKDFRENLRKAIFFQRLLKSQKGFVGKCPFEKNKQRCSVSHPLFEEYRMLCFLNNIRIRTEMDDKMRQLTQYERDTIIPLFFRKSKPHFSFEEICKKITPKGEAYNYFKSSDRQEKAYLFNFKMNATVSGCPTYAQLIDVFEEPLEVNILNHYILQSTSIGKKTYEEIITDIWHVLFTYDDTEKLVEFGKSRLQLDDGKAIKFSKISLKNEYASLSLKAIRKILPWLRIGLIYSHAVFLAKMEDIIPSEIWQNLQNREIIKNAISDIIDSHKTENQLNEIVNGLLKNCQTENVSWSENDNWQNVIKSDINQKLKNYYGLNTWKEFPDGIKFKYESEVINIFKVQMQKNIGRGEFVKSKSLEERIKDFLKDKFGIADSALSRIYHPSDIETFKKAGRAEDGNCYLGSPMVAAVRNPMAMRSLHQLRKVINEMLSEGLIDNDTKINIEMARDLNDSNERKAIQSWQRDRETKRKEYVEKIKELYKVETGKDIEPTPDEVLKYQFWEEQNHFCIYTGEQIGVSQFIGANTNYDLEHTIPQSLSYDNSQVNLTLCNNKFNREIKRNKIPYELGNYDEILSRVEDWKKKIEDLEEQIERTKRSSRATSDKEIKDRIIQKRHKLKLEHDYWYSKYKHFEMKDVPEGFKNSQLNDTRIITKYACQYLKTTFDKVFTVKGSTVADFRKMWGLQQDYEKKERVNHIHHCIDAITIACMTRSNYDELAHYYYELKQWDCKRNANKPTFQKPWETFTEDVKNIDKEVLISHYTPNNLLKQQKRKLRKRGKIQLNEAGKPLYLQGNTIRGSLHLESFYGAIKREIINKDKQVEGKILYVKRKPVDSLSQTDINNIVDESVKEKIQMAVNEKGLKAALSQNIWMNEDLKIPIKKVRCFATYITNPIRLKKHRDISDKEYKKYVNVANDENYLLAIYEGEDQKGKIKRDFELINNLNAGILKNEINQKDGTIKFVPDYHRISNLPIKQILKIGTMVILWADSPSEVKNLPISEIGKRLYKVTGLSSITIQNKYRFGVIKLKHHREARPSTKLKETRGVFSADEQYLPLRMLYHSQINALIEGCDFTISRIGKIEFYN